MPLTLRERKAIWHARQHYLKEFLFLLGPSPDEVETPAAFLSAFRYAISSINERITAEDPQVYDNVGAPQGTVDLQSADGAIHMEHQPSAQA